MLKTHIYIDSFNLYYHGLENILPGKVLGPKHKIGSIKYFMTLASGEKDTYAPIRQQTYKVVSVSS